MFPHLQSHQPIQPIQPSPSQRFSEAWVKAKAKYAEDLEAFKAAGGVILKPEKVQRVKRAAWRGGGW